MIDPNLLRNNLAEVAEKLKIKRGFILDVDNITQLEEKMNKFSSELANIENQLADTELYNAENKEKLTALLAQQVDVKKALDDVETEWMTAQEKLEAMLQA